MRNYREGFTLIELMVVVVIIGILAAIAIPNFVRIVNQAKEAEVKSNMHTVQLEVEYYCIEEASHNYPPSVDIVLDDLPSGMNNPFTPGGTTVQDESDADIPGVVEYATEDPNDCYSITGLGKEATVIHLILSPGRVD
jgi:prepilin-type N-terminal cleavage/methylation domain-containing protein